MVKILKRGTIYFQKCTKCGCEFAYMECDTTKWLVGVNNAEIICPDCGTALKCTFEKWKDKDDE